RYELRLTFDGERLSERRLVEMPGDKVLRRERYSAKGEVTVLDAEGKTLATVKGELAEAEAAPSLKADVKDLVVLDLPYRTPEQTRKALSVKAEVRDDALSFAQATQLLAAYAAAGDSGRARNLFQSALSNREQRQIGYYVLLASCGVNLDSDN